MARVWPPLPSNSIRYDFRILATTYKALAFLVQEPLVRLTKSILLEQ